MKKCMIGMLLAVLLLCRPFACVADSDPIAVKVGERIFYRSEVEQWLNQTAAYSLSLYSEAGGTITGSEGETLISEAAQHFVSKAIVEDKAAALGLDSLSEAEEEVLAADVRQIYEFYWSKGQEALKEAYPDREITDEEVTGTMAALGYSMDSLLAAQRLALLEKRLLQVYRPDLTVTDDEVTARYREQYVEPGRQRYENNYPLYEAQIVSGQSMTGYAPQGAFTVKYILLALPEDEALKTAVTDADAALEQAKVEKQQTFAALAEAAYTGKEDLSAERAACEAAVSALDAAQSAYDAAVQALIGCLSPTLNEISAGMARGESFEQQMRLFSTMEDVNKESDKGYPWHPDSAMWPAEWKDCIGSLTRTGQVSSPLYTAQGVVVFCRMGDLGTDGMAPLSDTDREALRSLILSEKRSSAIKALVQEWRGDYDILINTASLRVSIIP